MVIRGPRSLTSKATLHLLPSSAPNMSTNITCDEIVNALQLLVYSLSSTTNDMVDSIFDDLIIVAAETVPYGTYDYMLRVQELRY